MWKYIKMEKIKTIAFWMVVVFAVIIFAYILFPRGECWIWILDSKGNGFGTTTDYCFQLKNNCESSFHNVPCYWVEIPKVDSEKQIKGEFVEGCRCEMIWE